MQRPIIVSFATVFFGLSAANCADLWVSPAGTDAATGRGSQSAPYRTMAYACGQAASGDTVKLTSGIFTETAQTVLKSGVSIKGSGSTGTAKTVVNVPASWDYSADLWTDNVNGYLIKAVNIRNCTISGMELRGNGWRANGALYCDSSGAVTMSDCAIYDFRYYGLNLMNSRALSLSGLYIENSGFEYGKQSGGVLPDGGSLGNIGIHGVRKSVFHDIQITTTALHGYGMKLSNVDSCEFYHMSFDMYPYQSWNSPVGSPGGGNFDFENHGGSITMTSFHHCRFTATLSIMGGSGAIYDNVDYSAHLHHNLFDLGGDYGIELGTDKMVLDHNYFKDTWTCMQNYGHAETRIIGLTFCNNICENLGMRVIGSGGKLDNVRFFNNTILMSNDGGQSYLFTQEYENGSRNWFLCNNAINGDLQSQQNQAILSVNYGGTSSNVSNVYAGSNCFVNEQMAVQGDSGKLDTTKWNYVYANNINQDPSLPLTGTKPTQAFYPPATSPVVDRGDSLWGMLSAFSGVTRDIGAYERGQTAWDVGLQSTDTCLYVWAPISSIVQEQFVDSLRVDLRTSSSGAQIRYTLDGTEPNRSSTLYTGPVLITSSAKMRARSFKNGWGSPTAFIRDFTQGVQGYPNLALTATCSASSVYPERSSTGDLIYSCEKAIDGDYYNWIGWSPAAGDTLQWLSLDLGDAYVIKFVELFTRASVGNDASARRNFAIQGSTSPTFATFSTLASQGSTALPFEGVFQATVTNTMKFRYIRAIKTVKGEGFFITELRVRGDAQIPVRVGLAPRSPVAYRMSIGHGILSIRWEWATPVINAELLSLDGKVVASIAPDRLMRCALPAAGVYLCRIKTRGSQIVVKVSNSFFANSMLTTLHGSCK